MNRVRLGIIGMGYIGKYHADYLLRHQVKGCELVAVCRDKTGAYAKAGCRVFDHAEDLFSSGCVDAVLIATPHYQHTALGIAAFEAGLHVMMEKPISAHKADAERLIQAFQCHPGLTFGAMFQMRAESRFREIKRILENGQLGEITRFSWIASDWFRSEAYYKSGGWRATWKGEGGGVLINQCLHQLDMLQWLLGMPDKLRGFVKLGRFHDIEVEDDVTAYLEFPNGANGVFVSTTGEAPGTNRLEIVGTLGKLVLENDCLSWTQNAQSTTEIIESATLGFHKPDSKTVQVPITTETHQHAALLQNFVDAIVSGAPLIAPGCEGLLSLELANAILYSGLTERTVDLPLDSGAYEKMLGELAAGSRRKG